MIWYAKNVVKSWPVWGELRRSTGKAVDWEDRKMRQLWRNDLLIAFGLKEPPRETRDTKKKQVEPED